MPYVKFTTGHTECEAIQRYLEKGDRALATDFLNLDAPVINVENGHETYGRFEWAATMDRTRHMCENDRPWRGKPARTFKHYIISPDPGDKVDLPTLRRLAKRWAEENFGDYEVAIVYHNDNEERIPHAHVVVNNTNVVTGYRLQEPDPRSFRDSLRKIAIDMGMTHFGDEAVPHREGSVSTAPTLQGRHIGRAERELDSKGLYSWVSDIRSRVDIAKAVSRNEAEFVGVLNAMGINVDEGALRNGREDWVYSFSDHPTWRIRGEKLGLDYGMYAVERGFSIHGLDRASERRAVAIARNAVDVGDMCELRDLASFMATCERYAVNSIDELEELSSRLPEPERQRAQRAISYASHHEIIPARQPASPGRNEASNRPRSWEQRPWSERRPEEQSDENQQRNQQLAQHRRSRERNEHDR